jgi:hypothetical protein
MGAAQQVSLQGRVINSSYNSTATQHYNTSTTTIAPVATTAIIAFQNGAVVNYVTYLNSTCTVSPSTIYPTSPYAVNASKYTGCVTGSGAGTYINGAIPRYDLVPSFGGFSIYGNATYGATANGYPTWNGMTIITQCAASGTPSSCSDKKPGTMYFNPQYVVNEQALGIYNGLSGAPEGVLASAAHDDLLPAAKNNTVSRSYRITINVYDPNIFPNATTGKCTQLVASNVSNPTADCLTSVAALQAALTTHDSAVTAANAKNILWHNAGNITTQAVLLIANTTTLKLMPTLNISAPNTNLMSYSYISGPYTGAQSTTTVVPSTTAPTTVPRTTVTTSQTSQPSSYSMSSNTMLYAVVIVVIVIIILLAAWRMMAGKNKK